MKYIVTVKEIWDRFVEIEVDADSEKEARSRVSFLQKEYGNFTDDYPLRLTYSYSLHPDSWGVRKK